MTEILFELIALAVLALSMVMWPIFGRISMRRIEQLIMNEGRPRPCDWDGAGFRIILYASAMVMPNLAFDNRDERPGKLSPTLVNKYARPLDKALACVLLIAVYGVVLITIISMVFGLAK